MYYFFQETSQTKTVKINKTLLAEIRMNDLKMRFSCNQGQSIHVMPFEITRNCSHSDRDHTSPEIDEHCPIPFYLKLDHHCEIH